MNPHKTKDILLSENSTHLGYKKKRQYYATSIACVRVLSRFSRVRLFETPWTAARQAHLSVELCRQESWEWVAMPSSRGSF